MAAPTELPLDAVAPGEGGLSPLQADRSPQFSTNAAEVRTSLNACSDFDSKPDFCAPKLLAANERCA
jgi:hypothetical protein